MRPLSASQLQKYQACPAQWGAAYLEGLREPDTEATLRGKEVHKQLEDWGRDGLLPTHKVALAGLPYAPPPGMPGVTLERELRFSTPSSPFRGFVDLEQILSVTTISLQDWKTTSKASNAKTAAYLSSEDVQANLYAYESFQRGYATIVGRWIYLTTSGTPKAYPVIFTFEKNKTVDLVEGPIDSQASEIQKLYQLKPKWTELEKRTEHCYAYNRQCHVFDKCAPNRKLTVTLGAEQMKTDFRAAMQLQFPGTGAPPPPSAPPPPPPRAAPAAPNYWTPGLPLNAAQEMLIGMSKPLWIVASAADLPPPSDVSLAWPNAQAPYSALPPTDRGFVNPPEAPATPSPSPEAAAVRQAIAPPAAELQDDLNGLNRDALKALAVSLHAVPANTRAREVALRDAIRSVRSGGPTTLTAPPVLESTTIAPEAVATFNEATGFDPPPAAPPPGSWATASAEEMIADMKSMLSAQSVPFKKGSIEAMSLPIDLKSDKEIGYQGFDLFINCAPGYGTHNVLAFHALMQAAHDKIRETKPEVRDYRQISFTALAEINLAVREVIEGGFFEMEDALVVDTRTPDGAAVLTTLESLANTIVRGF